MFRYCTLPVLPVLLVGVVVANVVVSVVLHQRRADDERARARATRVAAQLADPAGTTPLADAECGATPRLVRCLRAGGEPGRVAAHYRAELGARAGHPATVRCESPSGTPGAPRSPIRGCRVVLDEGHGHGVLVTVDTDVRVVDGRRRPEGSRVTVLAS